MLLYWYSSSSPLLLASSTDISAQRCYSRYHAGKLVLYIPVSASSAGAAAEMAASRKQARFVALSRSYMLQPIVLQNISIQSTNRLCNSYTIWTTGSLMSLLMEKEGQFLFQVTTTLCRSAEIRCQLVARVVCDWRRPGPLADQLFLFNLLRFVNLRDAHYRCY